MKKYILISLLALIAAGCNYLDVQPADLKTDEMVWTNQYQVKQYLTNCYAPLPGEDLHKNDPWLGASDECDIVWYYYITYSMNIGSWDATSGYYNKWSSYYKAIRATFVLEENIGRCTEMPEETMTQYIGEATFLRGMYYFLLCRQYGPVVLIKEHMSNSTDFGSMPRNTFDECIDYVCEMMDKAKTMLPAYYDVSSENAGRATQGACLAVKAEARLLAASPQWNGNSAYATFTNADGTCLANTTYDDNKWKVAAAAAKECIDLVEANPKGMGLFYNKQDVTSESYNPYKAYYNIFMAGWNCEILFGSIDHGREDWTDNDQPRASYMVHCNPTNQISSAGMGGVSPTLRLIDAFYMENGKGIEDAGSGYVESGFAGSNGPHIGSDVDPDATSISETKRTALLSSLRSLDAWGHMKGDYNMCVNREPRFYASINYQHRIPLTVTTDVQSRNQWSSSKNQNGLGRLECYYGGMSNGTGNKYSYSSTGFFPQKKMVPCDFNVERTMPGKYVSIYFRYAQILLDYIEALNEYDPANSDIQKYWDMIHARAGICSIFDAHPEIKGNADQQREYIIRERQIELCLEGDRYFTTHRRLLCGGNDGTRSCKYGAGGAVWGLSTCQFGQDEITGNPETNGFSSPEFYVPRVIEERVWKDCYYLFPIPQTEIEKSPALVQNPGWEGTASSGEGEGEE